jgi:3-methylfumaryl-CoA hydratase
VIELDHLRSWIGNRQSAEQFIDPFPARALAGLLEREQPLCAGDALPLPWHWLYFLDTPSRSGIGADGHPQRGGFLPPVPLPRRMWAAGKLEVLSPLAIGRPATKTSTVRAVDLKDGQSGPLVFVTVGHELHQDGRVCLLEEQRLVYREAPVAPAPLAPGQPPASAGTWAEEFRADASLLFRFSALTYNGHRIHYDRDYATREEFYPALVVHGPLLATLLLDLLARRQPRAQVTRFEFRALRPAFDTDAIHLCGQPQEHGASLWTVDPTGSVGVQASAHLR